MRYLNTQNQSILREMVSADFKVRYQSSVLGYVWSLLKPLFMFAILYVVFTQIFALGKGVEHFPVYLFLGIVLWGFFVETTTTGVTAVVESGDLIRKISIPRYLVVVASSVSALINVGLNMIVVLIFAFINGVEPRIEWLLLPFLILELLVFAQAVAFFLSAAYVKFRDVSYIWELIIQAGFYATPIIYPVSKVPEQFQKLILANPLAQIIQDARYVFVTDTSVTIWSKVHSYRAFLPIVLIIITAVIAIIYFKKQSKTFAENL
jgi:ABC-2 type transport system permease protein